MNGVLITTKHLRSAQHAAAKNNRPTFTLMSKLLSGLYVFLHDYLIIYDNSKAHYTTY